MTAAEVEELRRSLDGYSAKYLEPQVEQPLRLLVAEVIRLRRERDEYRADLGRLGLLRSDGDGSGRPMSDVIEEAISEAEQEPPVRPLAVGECAGRVMRILGGRANPADVVKAIKARRKP